MKIFYYFFTMVFFFSYHSTTIASGGPLDKKFESDLELNSSSLSITLSKPVILVVDDNALIRKCLRKILENDYEIVEAENGKQALQACKERPFLFITMDWEMPVLNGPQAIQSIRQELCLSTPIFAITSCTEQHHREELMHVGVQGIFQKPFTKRNLSELIKIVQLYQ
ncbi:MAG: response regulator [Alphaproteobacteria bacterium]|nr:response regulator [Alphaproteobacteria bacterium]